MAFAVVLAGKGFAADSADKGALVGMCSQVRAEVVCSGEAFGTERALECSRMFLNAAVGSGGRAGRVGEFENVVTIGD